MIMGVIDGCERSSLACRPFYRRLAASRLLCDHHLVLKKPIIIVANNPLSYVGTDAKRDNDHHHHHAKPEHQQKNRFRLSWLKLISPSSPSSEIHQIRGQLPEKIPSIREPLSSSSPDWKGSHFQHYSSSSSYDDDDNNGRKLVLDWGQFSSIKSISTVLFTTTTK